MIYLFQITCPGSDNLKNGQSQLVATGSTNQNFFQAYLKAFTSRDPKFILCHAYFSPAVLYLTLKHTSTHTCIHLAAEDPFLKHLPKKLNQRPEGLPSLGFTASSRSATGRTKEDSVGHVPTSLILGGKASQT